MSYWHVTTIKKANEYKKSGGITPPVRAWINIEQAVRMSLSTGRRVIIRLSERGNWSKLEGHFQQAVVCNQRVKIE